MEFIRDNWPMLSFSVFLLVGVGRALMLLDLVSKRLNTVEERQDELEDKLSAACPLAECRKFRELCEMRNTSQFNEVKTMLRAMDDKREKSRDDQAQLLSDIACRMGRLEGQLAAERIHK